MNCTELILGHPKDKIAIGLPYVSYGELLRGAAGVQKKVQAGKPVLLMAEPDPAFFAAAIGLLAKGCPIVFVEPWMPLEKIRSVMEEVKPQAYICKWKGRLWGYLKPAIWKIPHWIHLDSAVRDGGELAVEDVDANAPGIITFTTGTSGPPKRVERSHGYLKEQHRVINLHLGIDQVEGNDLCIFPNFALANLASGRPSLLKRKNWQQENFVSCATGPAYLMDLLKMPQRLKSIHVGGALTDCWIFEEAFKKWPEAQIDHVYGSSEVEPVAVVDARQAIQKSRERGFFQTLFIGKPVPELEYRQGDGGFEVKGSHVVRSGWHKMGDRILEDEAGFWYGGRSFQRPGEFELEQRIYQRLGHSKAFIEEGVLYGEDIPEGVLQGISEIRKIVPSKILRDPRHRARIDRQRSKP